MLFTLFFDLCILGRLLDILGLLYLFIQFARYLENNQNIILMAKSSAAEITTGDAHENFAFVAENSFHMRSPCDFTKVFSANFLNSLSSVNVNKPR